MFKIPRKYVKTDRNALIILTVSSLPQIMKTFKDDTVFNGVSDLVLALQAI